MNKSKLQKNQGIISLVVMIVIGILVLSYFGFNLKNFLDRPIVKENLSYAWSLAIHGWGIVKAIIFKFIP